MSASELAVSYEFKLFKLNPGEAPRVTVGQISTGFPNTPPDPSQEALKRRVAEALRAHSPQLEVLQFPYEQIARFEQVSLEEARRKYRQVELSDPASGEGVKIILRDDHASVTVPFWHAGQRAADLFQRLGSYLAIISRETGYVIYDTQLGDMLDPGAGCLQALAQYNETVRQLRRGPAAVGPAESSVPLMMQAALWPASTHPPGAEIRQLTAPGGVVLVARREDGSLCGYAQASILSDGCGRPSSIACLEGWYVAPEFRGQGLGRQLLESTEHWAAAGGAKELTSRVRLDNERSVRSLGTHFRCGFTETLRAVHFTKPITVNGATRVAT